MSLSPRLRKWLTISAGLAFLFAALSVFVDQAVLVRKNTFYLAKTKEKVVALTFDDGPSPQWTPLVLDELKRANVQATFFMVGKHVELYPDVARRVAAEGHEIGNHSYRHPVLLFSSPDQLKAEVLGAQTAIERVVGKKTNLFRPPKGWLTDKAKAEVSALGYTVVLWTLNSKDWVNFDDKYIIRYILKNVRPGDIILFHDSGGVFRAEGGNRHETVATIYRLVEKLREKGYRCVTISELLGKETKK